jgi:hypothetical protein
MNNNEIQKEAQKYEDALLQHREGDISSKLGQDTKCQSKDDFNKIMDAWKDINEKDRKTDSSLPSVDINHAGQDVKSVTVHDAAAGINAQTLNTPGQHAMSAGEAIAAGLAVGAIVDSLTPPTPVENQAAIAAGDNEAGRINNMSVVSDSDISALQGALGSISGATAGGQYAQARVGAALDAAKAKIAAGRAAGAGGDYAQAQQFGSPQAFEAYKKQQADKEVAEKQK